MSPRYPRKPPPRPTWPSCSGSSTTEARPGAGAAGRTRTERHNLAHTLPAGKFDLISAHYLHTPVELARAEVLRAVAHLLAPGGLLLIVDHGSVAPWSWNRDADTHFPTAAEKFAELALDPAGWHAERLDAPRRTATGPDGQTATVTDHVIAVRRAVRRNGQEKRSGLNTSASTTSRL